MLAQINIHVSPNNRVSISRVPVTNFHNQGKPRSSYKSVDEQLFDDFLADNSPDAGTGALALRVRDGVDDCSLGISSELQEKKIPEIPTKKKFTRLGRQTILAAAGALEKEGHQPGDFVFFTGTLPGSSPEACEYMARYSRYIVNSLKQYLRDMGLYTTFNTWEWQKRDRVNGRYLLLTPALHLHMCILCTDKDLSAKLSNLLRQKWLDILDLVSLHSGQSLYERDISLGGLGFWDRNSDKVLENCCKTIICEKSPAAYLSKYVGKDSFINQGFADFCLKKGVQPFYPSSWWSISNELRQLIKKWSCSFSFRMPFEQAEAFIADIVDFFSVESPIVLPAFSPDGFPDYLYRVFYVNPEIYEYVISILTRIFADFKDTDSGFATLPTFGHLAIRWLQLPKNYILLDKFFYSLTYSQRCLSFDNPWLIYQAAKWVMNIFVSRENVPTPFFSS